MNDRAGSCLQMQCPVIRRSLDERPSSKKARAQRTLFEMKQIRTSKPRRTCDRLTSMPGLCLHKAWHGSGRLLDERPSSRKMRAKRALFEMEFESSADAELPNYEVTPSASPRDHTNETAFADFVRCMPAGAGIAREKQVRTPQQFPCFYVRIVRIIYLAGRFTRAPKELFRNGYHYTAWMDHS